MKKAWAERFRGTAEILLLLAIVLSAAFLASLLAGFQSPGDGEADEGRTYNIAIVGKGSRRPYLEEILAGAKTLSKEHDAAVFLYTGMANAQDLSTQALLNYASYAGADGVIAYIESGDEALDVPKSPDGKEIPLVAIGSLKPGLRQLSYIGPNYSELGKITAREIVSQIGQSAKAILLDSNEENDTNHSNLTAGILLSLQDHPEISVKTLQFEKNSSFSREDNLRQLLASEEGLELIVSLSERNTILAAQSARDLNLSGRVKIIGFGDSDDCRSYFEKNIVTELISVKTQGIGRAAMRELFEYLRYGYANSIVSAEVEVLGGGE